MISSHAVSDLEPWLAASRAFDADPKAKVPCPDCGKAMLTLKEVRLKDGSGRTDRHIRCPACKARIQLLKAPPKVIKLPRGTFRG